MEQFDQDLRKLCELIDKPRVTLRARMAQFIAYNVPHSIEATAITFAANYLEQWDHRDENDTYGVDLAEDYFTKFCNNLNAMIHRATKPEQDNE